MNKLEQLKQLLQAIKACTNHVDNHSDPNSINDCWNSVDDILSELESLKKRAKQMLREQDKIRDNAIKIGGNPKVFHEGCYNGVSRIVELIDRHI